MFGYTQLYEIHFYIRAISPSHMASYQQVLGLSHKETGEVIDHNLELDNAKIAEEEKYDGYYTIVTSELSMLWLL